MQPSGVARNAAASPRPLVTSRAFNWIEAWTRPVLDIGIVAVYSTVDGSVEYFDRPLTRKEAISGRFRRVHYVDVARRLTAAPADPQALPARNDRYYFSAVIAAMWRVADPATVVRERVVRGEQHVLAAVRRLTREISRRHEILDCQAVEDEINRLAGRRGSIILTSCGIAVEQITAQVSLDPDTQAYLQQQDLIERTRDLEDREFHRQQEALRHQQVLEELRMEAIVKGVRGEFDLVAFHLRHHPEKAIEVVQMLHAWQREMEERDEARFKNSSDLFRTMVDQGLLQNIDVEEIRDGVLRNIIVDVVGSRVTPDVRLRDFPVREAEIGAASAANGQSNSGVPSDKGGQVEGVPSVEDPAETGIWRQRGPSDAS